MGSEEADSRSVNVRNRDDVGVKGRTAEIIKLDDVLKSLHSLKDERRLKNSLQAEAQAEVEEEVKPSA